MTPGRWGVPRVSERGGSVVWQCLLPSPMEAACPHPLTTIRCDVMTQFARAGDHLIVGSEDKRLAWYDLDLSSKPYRALRYHNYAVRGTAFHRCVAAPQQRRGVKAC